MSLMLHEVLLGAVAASEPPVIDLNAMFYHTIPAGNAVNSYTVPAGKVDAGDAMLLLFQFDTDARTPTISAPAGSSVIAYGNLAALSSILTPDPSTTGAGSAGGSGFGVAISTATTSTPTISWSVPVNTQTGGLVGLPLPSRFATAPRQVMAHLAKGFGLGANLLSTTFSAPFSGYYFVAQGYDINSSGTWPIPGTTAPHPDQSYGVEISSPNTGWLPSQSFIVPDAVQGNGGTVMRVDAIYLNAGESLTVGNGVTTNTPACVGMHFIVIGFNTSE